MILALIAISAACTVFAVAACVTGLENIFAVLEAKRARVFAQPAEGQGEGETEGREHHVQRATSSQERNNG